MNDTVSMHRTLDFSFMIPKKTLNGKRAIENSKYCKLSDFASQQKNRASCEAFRFYVHLL